MGIKTKITFAMFSLIFITAALIAGFSYRKSQQELTAAVETGNLNLAHTVAAKIQTINEREFKTIETVANLSIFRDPSVDLQEKWRLANSVTKGKSKYMGMGCYDEKGVGYSTTGVYHDMSNREYIAEAMKGKNSLMDPDWSKTNGHLCTYYGAPFYNESGKQIGILAVIVNASDLCQTMTTLTVGKASHPFVISRRSGRYVAHENQKLVEENTVASDVACEGFKPILDRIMNGETAAEVYYDEIEKKKYAVSYQPIDGCEWSAVCVAPYKDFYNGISELLFTMILISVGSLIFAVIVGMFVVKLSIKPLKDVSSAISGIASGDADLTKRLNATANDEIGEVVQGFNKFSEKLQAIIGDVKNSKDELMVAGENLNSSTQDTASSITQIIANIDSMKRQIEGQNQSVNQTAGAVTEIASNIESLGRMVQNQSSGVTQASAAVEEMIGNISSVNTSMDKMAYSFSDLRSNSQVGIDKQRAVNERIEQIETQSQMLQEANVAIANIASQTNLLAMNAAIEAAHAGEAGKGFAVVADEIRKLSETSTAQSKTIGNQLTNIKESIGEVVAASSEASIAFEAVSKKLEDTDALVMQIKSAMEEQNEGSKQITEALHNMQDSTLEVKNASAEMEEGNKMILAEVQSLQDAAMHMTSSMEEMSIGAKKINETGVTLKEVSEQIGGSISQIGEQVDQFKV
ncbi:methyl-accepting chemotaxis protein [Treponema sp. C6A8]|uniref:methyl-accepting chemotaxis protein n=1 Tax=Treponema sp. C6A8 TaxID=1410609 RepID=UPI0004875C63|nr:methyl-accepting chemotaxis protein [Treponema sp. C6A8]